MRLAKRHGCSNWHGCSLLPKAWNGVAVFSCLRVQRPRLSGDRPPWICWHNMTRVSTCHLENERVCLIAEPCTLMIWAAATSGLPLPVTHGDDARSPGLDLDDKWKPRWGLLCDLSSLSRLLAFFFFFLNKRWGPFLSLENFIIFKTPASSLPKTAFGKMAADPGAWLQQCWRTTFQVLRSVPSVTRPNDSGGETRTAFQVSLPGVTRLASPPLSRVGGSRTPSWSPQTSYAL